MAKLVFFSDTHNDHNNLEPGSGDILVHSGDACIKGNYTEGLDFLWWYVKQNFKYKILVPGNHDSKLKTHPDLIKLAQDMGILVLNDHYVEIDQLKIYGCSSTFQDVIRKPAEEERKDAWKNIPKGLDLLITHMPPYGIFDANTKGDPIGCPFLLDKVKEVRPSIHVFGHCHEEAGSHKMDYGVSFYNYCVKDRTYATIKKEGYRLWI